MIAIPEDLDAALESLYDVFAQYRPRGPIEHSPLKPRSVVEALEAKPLRDLTADDFLGYSGSAVWTVGTLNDFKYFFPRMAELALHEVVGGAGWDSWASRLRPGLTVTSELLATQRFFSTLWRTMTTPYWDGLKVDPVELLYALSSLFDDIEPFLAVFHPCASRGAMRSLDHICAVGQTWLRPKSERPTQIANWLAERAYWSLAEAQATFHEP